MKKRTLDEAIAKVVRGAVDCIAGMTWAEVCEITGGCAWDSLIQLLNSVMECPDGPETLSEVLSEHKAGAREIRWFQKDIIVSPRSHRLASLISGVTVAEIVEAVGADVAEAIEAEALELERAAEALKRKADELRARIPIVPEVNQ